MTQIILKPGESLDSGLARLQAALLFGLLPTPQVETETMRSARIRLARLPTKPRVWTTRLKVIRPKRDPILPHKCLTNGCAKMIVKPTSDYCLSCQCSRRNSS